MSREIPLDQPLTERDRRHLRQLGSHGQHLERRIDTEFPPDAEALAAFEAEHRNYLASMNGTGLTTGEQDILRDENARLRAELEELKARMEAPAAKGPDYTGWTKAQLEAEVDRVNGEDSDANLSKGKVAEMVTALTEYFTE